VVEAVKPVSGTQANGVWRLSIQLPQGFPPGTYALQVWARDTSHWRDWVSPESPAAVNDGQAVLTPAQLGGTPSTVVVVPAP
jgi:hypothetical protein